SLEMIVAVIAIFKSGGAFVPVEPDIPRERLAFILGETQAAVILTQESIAPTLPGGTARVLCIESFGPPGEPDAGANLPHETSADTLAYIIYTSGSTGTPKGVEITHGALAEHALETIGRYGLSGRDRVLQFSSLSFDASLEQYIPPLIAGGAVVVREGEVWGPAEAYRRVNELGITVLHMSTAYWHELAQGWSTLAPPAQFRTLRLLVAGGETMTGGSVDLWRKGPTGGIVLLNAYGPTEATIAATTYDLPAEPPGGGSFAGRRIPIGRRRGAKRLFILDTHCEPVPIGVAGELYIGGNTVSRGYRMRPELNAQAFIPDPFPGGEGRRLYRTGDRARFLSGGDIEFLGRNDFQIKIRGFRVELGEIESALAAHPAVAESVVVAAGDGGLERRLVAFVVPGGGAPARTDDLRAFLAARLPAYMVPGAFVTLDALPKTKNGKVDYRALPLPEATPAAKSTDYQAPRDALERQLVGIWEKLFGRSPIGIRDNFFDLGGHSLLAVRLFSQVERLTAKNLPLVTLFQAPTIGDLAAILRTQGWEPPWSSLVPIKPGGSRPPFYCVHGVGGNILEFEHFSRYIDPDQPLYGLQAQGLDGKRPRHSSVEEMAAHYISEIRMFQPRGPYYLGGSSFGGMVAFEMAQQLRAAGEEVGLLALFDTNAPGYPRYLPQTTKLKRWLGHARFRVELHWQNIAVADAALRREYVMAKAGRFVKQYRAKLRIKSRGLVRSISDRILPRAIRRVQQGGHDANRSYRARPYAGKVTLFRATEQPYSIIADPANGWAPYCPGGLEILDVPGHHGAIMREPRAGVLVKTLMESLTRAQSSRNGGASGKGETQ
ncbi:MAG TPA: amino acid adenylation domain-containing protein, partial [Bacteroidota bacterium]|nr:amino acid adenylation domain-containing protein [Bacteroidota bacterium]